MDSSGRSFEGKLAVWRRRLGIRPLTIALLAVCVALAACSARRGDWRTAERGSAGIAPDAVETQEAVILAYGAATYGWRGYFADHTWIATKREAETEYTIYEVIGWRSYRGLPVVRVSTGAPDRHWFGAPPRELLRLQGEGVEELVGRVEDAVASYPWPDKYRAFPGPNSNTFTAWIAKQVPELGLSLPLRAVGKSYLLSADIGS